MITASTVGYGHVYPTDDRSKIVVSFQLLFHFILGMDLFLF